MPPVSSFTTPRPPGSTLFPYTTLFRSHPVRAEDLDHPDELRVDLDPVPGLKWPQVRAVARVVQAALEIGKHTSELQSHHDLVCRLLLEKKNSSLVTTTLRAEPRTSIVS